MVEISDTNKTTKKVVREKTTKKVKNAGTKKKVTKKADVKKISLKKIPKEHYFVLVNGHQIKDYKHLADVLETLEDHLFEHHVNVDKNDFAVWIQDIFKEIDLAKELTGIKRKEPMRLAIYKHIVHKHVK